MSTDIKGKATLEELTMIRDSIMYPYMLTMCQKSLDDLRISSNLFKQQFEQLVILIMDAITRNLAAIKRGMAKSKIKVWEDETKDGILYHKYICRGYESRFGIIRETLRSEISVRLTKYANGVLANPVH